MHLLTDANGLPLAALLSAGQRHESTCFEALMNEVALCGPRGRPLTRPKRVAGDKGYSYPRIRRWLRSHRIEAVIPQRSDQLAQHRARALNFDRMTYRQRNAVERCIGWLKACRRLATRYEKLAENYQAMIELAFIQRYLALGFSDTT